MKKKKPKEIREENRKSRVGSFSSSSMESINHVDSILEKPTEPMKLTYKERKRVLEMVESIIYNYDTYSPEIIGKSCIDRDNDIINLFVELSVLEYNLIYTNKLYELMIARYFAAKECYHPDVYRIGNMTVVRNLNGGFTLTATLTARTRLNYITTKVSRGTNEMLDSFTVSHPLL